MPSDLVCKVVPQREYESSVDSVRFIEGPTLPTWAQFARDFLELNGIVKIPLLYTRAVSDQALRSVAIRTFCFPSVLFRLPERTDRAFGVEKKQVSLRHTAYISPVPQPAALVVALGCPDIAFVDPPDMVDPPVALHLRRIEKPSPIFHDVSIRLLSSSGQVVLPQGHFQSFCLPTVVAHVAKPQVVWNGPVDHEDGLPRHARAPRSQRSPIIRLNRSLRDGTNLLDDLPLVKHSLPNEVSNVQIVQSINREESNDGTHETKSALIRRRRMGPEPGEGVPRTLD